MQSLSCKRKKVSWGSARADRRGAVSRGSARADRRGAVLLPDLSSSMCIACSILKVIHAGVGWGWFGSGNETKGSGSNVLSPDVTL